MIDLTIFDSLRPDGDKLLSSGFACNNYGDFCASFPVADGDLTFRMQIKGDGTVCTSVTDTETEQHYLPYYIIDDTGAYIGSVNKECQAIAQCLADKCFTRPGLKGQAEQVSAYMLSKYNSVSEHLWPDKYPDYAVWRRTDNDKWIGIVMQIPGAKLGIKTDRVIQILDLHAAEDTVASVDSKTIFPAYHMNKKH